ncbi:molybdenum cofactor biosynthesis protein B [Ponticaulis sp.]|uniref:molybdenum cofactor biosynthesis protein B n=1 Tax=Ponticaulis sp. TaxID=2020902 RepID=UPI000C5C560E|nr:molybdenum cofactor biosynthesis protein B [Ponticaulis sp.]MAJ08364.1 molybdenum cofactor biosynthesis protein B [Ponticaulis sp.]HBH88750.1 molybdenum cofactor biosynthesis protein B [Hyphomonadaceae bacterium]HBJ92338.1 molybdenum cofactor biosynthesis protein B [Hyphomonadaceae bacterium]|tara:strand:+ start:26636 stop:27166 length:531 start_codon:yes stop_codon:yes gene_type:complete
MAGIDDSMSFKPVRIAVLVVSDTRTMETDTSGQTLADRLTEAGHVLADRKIVIDDRQLVRQAVQNWIADPEVDAVITSGGTGLTGRDVTVEALTPLFDKVIDGFSAVFHQVSFQTVGLSTLQSRAVAGLAGSTFVFCLPGSTGAVKDGWDQILKYQLDSRYRPCNMVELMPRLTEV